MHAYRFIEFFTVFTALSDLVDCRECKQTVKFEKLEHEASVSSLFYFAAVVAETSIQGHLSILIMK